MKNWERFKSFWDPSVKWRRVGLSALVSAILNGILVAGWLLDPQSANTSLKDRLILGAFFFMMWVGVTLMASVYSGSLNLYRSFIRSQNQN